MSIIIESKKIYKKENSIAKGGIERVENDLIVPVLSSEKKILSANFSKFFNKNDVYDGDVPLWREFYETYLVLEDYVLLSEGRIDICTPSTISAKISASVNIGVDIGDMTFPSYLVNRFDFQHMSTGNVDFSLNYSDFGVENKIDVALPYIHGTREQGTGIAQFPIKIVLSDYDEEKKDYMQENVKVSMYLPARFDMKTPEGYHRFVVVDNMSVELTSSLTDLSKKELVVEGENSKKKFSFEDNIFNQTTTKTDGTISSVLLSKEIVEKYKNGKETAKIKCSISDYFSDDGNIAIDTKTGKMSFDIGDLVVPMIFSAGGEDIPMSKYMDGTPKVFRVVGIKFIYDGAVWQELTLQEV